MPVTREIPRDEWIAFLDAFSRQHEGWLITIEVLGSAIGAQIEASEVPLAGVTAGTHGGGTISIMTGRAPEATITHTVPSPSKLRLEETDDGAPAALQILAEDGTMTLVRFRSAMPPEMVDGVASPHGASRPPKNDT